MIDEAQQRLREALKTVAVTLKAEDTPFALAGSYGLWARGAPEPVHDVDFVVAEEDAPRVEMLLADRGLRVEQPPEDWLFKVWLDDAMVDVLFRANGESVTRELLADVDCLEVESVLMPVLGATELMAHKLGAMEEHACDLGKVLPAARAVREQVDWDRVAAETEGNPFAAASLYLLRRLGVAPDVEPREARGGAPRDTPADLRPAERAG